MDANIFAVLLLMLAALVAFGNAAGALQAVRRQRRGDPRGFSTIPLLGPLCVLGAAATATQEGSFSLPSWLFWLVASLDVSTWSLLCLPVFAFRRGLRK
jgi:hypothetical protein